MPEERETTNGALHDDILTSAEAATYLRVSEDAVLSMAHDGRIPSQQIGEEWRFLRKALQDWMRYTDRPYRNGLSISPEAFMESPFAEELLFHLEERLLRKLKMEPGSARGSKQAVLRHFGAFKDDDDLEDRLADARARREAAG